jgi:hypothetical protein
MARDRTARNRIRRFLATQGPLSDSQGLATKRLKEAVGYEGSPVAFIQLIAAMERDGELVRDIRGKRTYRIAVGEDQVVRQPAAEPAVLETPAGSLEVDYDVLARSLLQELTGTRSAGVLDEMRAENQRIAHERDEYAHRLQLARAKLDELRGSIQEHGSTSVEH